MMIADGVNATFELSGGFAIWLSIKKLWLSRRTDGVHYGHVAFFTAWGVWNLIYYPSLGQTLSTIGGVGVLVTNMIYLYLCFRFQTKVTT